MLWLNQSHDWTFAERNCHPISTRRYRPLPFAYYQVQYPRHLLPVTWRLFVPLVERTTAAILSHVPCRRLHSRHHKHQLVIVTQQRGQMSGSGKHISAPIQNIYYFIQRLINLFPLLIFLLTFFNELLHACGNECDLSDVMNKEKKSIWNKKRKEKWVKKE